MFCFMLMDVSDPKGLIEDREGVIKKDIFLPTFSEWFGTTFDAVIRKPRLRFVVSDPDLSLL